MRTSARLCMASAMLSVLFLTSHATVAGHHSAPDSEPVRAWNQLALQTVRTLRLSDAQAARLYAMVNVAMYDAVNGIVSRRGNDDRRPALVPGEHAPAHGDLEIAAAAAAHAVLAGEYPSLIDLYNQQLQEDRRGGRGSAGQEWGAWVGAQVRALRANDGSTPVETQPGSTAPGHFRASWSGVQFRNLRPFGVQNSTPYFGAGHPPLDSYRYAAAFAEVKLLGNAAIPDDTALATYNFWSLGAGTSQPPGAWIQVALAVAERSSLRLPDMTRLFALLSMALSDTVAPTVMTKYQFHFWRPATAIQEADTDGNMFTDADPSWAPRAGGIGTSPEYWSGHSIFSGAAAGVLAAFYCADDIPFELSTDSGAGEVRRYARFSDAATEAGLSRVLGGIHFQFSNIEALAKGRAIAAEIVANKLLKRRGQTHFGQCPL